MKPMPAAFEEIYRSHAALVRGALGRLGVAPAHLEDATQDVFLVLHRRMPAFDGQRSLRNWLWGIARGVASTYRRSARRRQRLGNALASHGVRMSPSLEDSLAGREAMRQLGRFLSQLDEDRCAVFVLSELEGCTGPEISEQLQVNLNTVYGRLKAARRCLAQAQEQTRRPMLVCVVPWWSWSWRSVALCSVSGTLALSLAGEPVADDLPHTASWAVRGMLPTPAHAQAPRRAVAHGRELVAARIVGVMAKDPVEGDGAAPAPAETTMQRSTLKYAAMTTLLSTAAPAQAAAAEPDPWSTTTVDRYLEFEADSLEGEILRPMESLVPARGSVRWPSLIQVRAHFNPELTRLGEDV